MSETRPFDGSRAEPRETAFEPARTLYVNPAISSCPACAYKGSEEEVVQHIVKHHPQKKLDGTLETDDDKKEKILAALHDEQFQCPFCFNVFPHAKVTRFFLDDGKLSKMVVCKQDAGGCGQRMTVDSMRQARASPTDFGHWVGAYSASGFWKKVDHDKWMKGLQMLYKFNKELMDQFWKAYAELNPKFAEKQRNREIDQQAKAYAAETDQVDESGR